ncbi:MAG: FUN14 domain-containing protein [Methylovulum sp.]|nr:FUN14 domain-containing protein [Methylovulum sp.]
MNNNVINTPSPDFFSADFMLGNVGAPFVIGLAVGYFAKKMLRIALFLSGGAIVLLFAGEYYGVVHITDSELQNVASSATGVAKSSGDFLVQRLSSITSKGITGAAGFFTGFKLG